MRRISANYIFPVNTAPLKNGIIELDENGIVKNIIDTKGELRESRNLEFYNGVIVPGFINTHCHLELSHLKGLVEPHIGLPRFISEMIRHRREKGATGNTEPMEFVDKLMVQNGIVAVGDISNSNKTIAVKKKSKIHYHTFIELIGLDSNTEEIYRKNLELYLEFIQNDLNASIVPHAPYSVSEELFQKIKKFAEKSDAVISIHSQESKGENQLFKTKSGELFRVFETLGINWSGWNATGKNSVESIISWLPENNNILFVHNTYSSKEDVELVNKNIKNAYWCLCPLSNQYIEDKLPDFSIFNQLSNKVTIGTDSLASNTALSIIGEMKAIVKNYPEISFAKLIQWSTLNGAKALKVDDNFGSIEINKNPGINLITNFDFKKMQITEASGVKVLA